MKRKPERSAPGETIVPCSEFARSFGRFREHATAGKVVKVSSHGRIVGAFISASELEHFENLKRRERQVYGIEDMPEELFEQIMAAEYGKTAG